MREIDKPFLMPIEDVFSIKGRGTVATGRIERGIVKVGDKVEIIGLDARRAKTVVTGVEMFNKTLDAGPGRRQRRRCCSAASKRDEIERGQVLAQARLDHAAHEVRGRGLRPVQGGRRPAHAVLQRLPAAVLLPHDRRDRLDRSCPRGAEMCMPGDNTEMEVELIQPIAMDEGLRFAIREGGRTVGSGVVTTIIK